ncbi:asparagine synthase (glutamine-hydrolyzing) [Candidatus Pelagibacter sp.]|nr:asparagine synthase (glutamine-hydrolyzing) [Candidatus Pelagibacter sp.]
MCGFFGQINLNQGLVAKNDFVKSSEVLFNRGPDAKGYNTDNLFYQLVFYRLSIIDLTDTGNQPMVSSCGRYLCVFNGEIYNHKEIFNEIKNHFEWRGKSDTEILLNGWILFKERIFSKLNGMFSFAIWDKLKKKLVLARDRLGEKPLFYSLASDNSIFFSSRPQPIINLFPDLKKNIDQNNIDHYLQYGFFSRFNSFYENIKKLEPGCYLEFSDSTIKIKKYWSLSDSFSEINKDKNIDDYANELDELLQHSISQRIVSDKPLGFFLSGGLDSSLILAMASKIINQKDLKIYNLGFKEKAYDESQNALTVTNYLGLHLNKFEFKADQLLGMFNLMEKNFDEPFSDPACFPLMALSQNAKKNVDVVLTGDGADELFGGYPKYMTINYLYKFSFLIKLISKTKITDLLSIFKNTKLEIFLKTIKFKSNVSRYLFLKNNQKIFDDISHLNDKYLIINKLNNLDNLLKGDENELERIMKIDLLTTFNDNYLQKTDLSTMLFSLEARAPFLSNEIIEWSTKLPIEFKLNLFKNKLVLKKLAMKYLPDKIINNPKKGFELPINEWLKKDLKEWALELIHNTKNYNELKLDKKKIINIFNEQQSGNRFYVPYIWNVLILLNFCKSKLDK